MNDAFHVDMEKLMSLHRFGDVLDDAIKSVGSETVELVPDRGARDSIGRHWYGSRCHMRNKETDEKFYLHIGLIYLPETRTGLLVELDKRSNPASFPIVWENLGEGSRYEISRDEDDYLKLFMPQDAFDALCGKKRGEQVKAISDYIKECAEAIAAAACQAGFSLKLCDLAEDYKLACAFEEAVVSIKSERYTIEPDRKCPDNFGQYAAGYRCFVKTRDGQQDLYPYFGAIYSYKKTPYGIFAEIDKLNHPGCYDRAYAGIKEDPAYELSKKDPPFIKMFMPAADIERLNSLDHRGQVAKLAEFLDTCITNLLEAARV